MGIYVKEGEFALEELREKLLELINNKGTKDDEVLKVSQQLDNLINDFYNTNSSY